MEAVLLGTFRFATQSLLQIQPGSAYRLCLSLGKLHVLCRARGLNTQKHFPGVWVRGSLAGMKVAAWKSKSVKVLNPIVLSTLWFPQVLSYTAKNVKYFAKEYRYSQKNPTTMIMLLLLSRNVTLVGLDSALILILHHEILWLLWCCSWPLWWSPQLRS